MMTDQTDPLGALVLKSNFWTYLYFSFTYLIQTQFQLGIWSINQTNRQTERHTHVHHKSLSTLSQKSATVWQGLRHRRRIPWHWSPPLTGGGHSQLLWRCLNPLSQSVQSDHVHHAPSTTGRQHTSTLLVLKLLKKLRYLGYRIRTPDIPVRSRSQHIGLLCTVLAVKTESDGLLIGLNKQQNYKTLTGLLPMIVHRHDFRIKNRRCIT